MESIKSANIRPNSISALRLVLPIFFFDISIFGHLGFGLFFILQNFGLLIVVQLRLVQKVEFLKGRIQVDDRKTKFEKFEGFFFFAASLKLDNLAFRFSAFGFQPIIPKQRLV